MGDSVRDVCKRNSDPSAACTSATRSSIALRFISIAKRTLDDETLFRGSVYGLLKRRTHRVEVPKPFGRDAITLGTALFEGEHRGQRNLLGI